ncbi:MAG: hypothetical protein HDS13_03815 [Bacteroides sp.]|nr:hypothetical protein [Bacteroides sp.]
MNKSKIKKIIKESCNSIYSFVILNLYTKPSLLIKLLKKPSKIWEESYFPELQRKNKIRILYDQIYNIFSHGAIDEYYYMYGLDVKRDIKNSDYVIYRDFLIARDKLNLSNPHNDSSILRNKLFFEAVARSLGIQTPKNIAYSDNGILVPLHNQNFFSWLTLPKGIFYVKPIDGECGTGILKLLINDTGIYINEKLVTSDELKLYFNEGRYIFQDRLEQHPQMNRIYPNSVNTIRMTTVRNPHTGRIEVLPPTLRVGAHGSYVDNFSKGGVIVAMDTQSGKLAEWGFFKPMYGFKSQTHPDTNIKFSTFKVPFYEEAKAKAIFFHSFLNLHSIGWDIAITKVGPVFIEGNDNWEINLPQTFENPIKKDFNRLFK